MSAAYPTTASGALTRDSVIAALAFAYSLPS
jgi:hypothetical protein